MFRSGTARLRSLIGLSKILSVFAAAVVVGVMLVGLSQPAAAFLITQLDDFDKGTPCDGVSPPEGACDLYEVSGLVTGDSFTVEWDFTSGVDTVDVSATFDIDDIIGDTLTLTVTITNNSTAPITALGLTTGDDALDPDKSGFVIDGAGEFFDMFTADPTKGLGGKFDACVFSTGCFMSNPQDAIPAGGDDIFTVALVASDGIFDGTLDHFVIKMQGENSWEVPGTPCCISIPEPSTLLLFGTGLLGFRLLARRRRAA